MFWLRGLRGGSILQVWCTFQLPQPNLACTTREIVLVCQGLVVVGALALLPHHGALLFSF
jgi:hypothetical protein